MQNMTRFISIFSFFFRIKTIPFFSLAIAIFMHKSSAVKRWRIPHVPMIMIFCLIILTKPTFGSSLVRLWHSICIWNTKKEEHEVPNRNMKKKQAKGPAFEMKGKIHANMNVGSSRQRSKIIGVKYCYSFSVRRPFSLDAPKKALKHWAKVEMNKKEMKMKTKMKMLKRKKRKMH